MAFKGLKWHFIYASSLKKTALENLQANIFCYYSLKFYLPIMKKLPFVMSLFVAFKSLFIIFLKISVYIDMGNVATDTTTLAFTFTGTSTTRLWEIKVSQVSCNNPSR
jgi:hypothetical protein